MVAEFEADLGHLRTREGMVLAKRQGKRPELPESAQRSIRRRYATGESPSRSRPPKFQSTI